jgi:uncharacterized membrane protein YcaP (DUF421 family)
MSLDLFGSWSGALRILVFSAPTYVGLALVRRFARKRTVSEDNLFKLIEAVGMSSAIAPSTLFKSKPWAKELSGRSILVLFQDFMGWLFVWSVCFQSYAPEKLPILLHRGEWQRKVIRRVRAIPERIVAAPCGEGTTTIDASTAVLIETDGSLSVLTEPSSSAGLSHPSDVASPRSGGEAR